MQTMAAGVAIVVVVAAVTTGLVMVGSPSDQRARRLDGRRLASDVFPNPLANWPGNLGSFPKPRTR
jgi:hypothetical protein